MLDFHFKPLGQRLSRVTRVVCMFKMRKETFAGKGRRVSKKSLYNSKVNRKSFLCHYKVAAHFYTNRQALFFHHSKLHCIFALKRTLLGIACPLNQPILAYCRYQYQHTVYASQYRTRNVQCRNAKDAFEIIFLR